MDKIVKRISLDRGKYMFYTNNLERLRELCRKDTNYYMHSIDLVAACSFFRREIALFLLDNYPYHRAMEGLLGKRPYAGTKYYDEIESIGVAAAKRVFKAENANIQPHSGSQANQIAYLALLNSNDRVLAMKFTSGGHLTHGKKINFSGKFYQFDFYGINPETQLIDYDELEEKAFLIKPKLIIAGASSYPRIIDYQRISEIAKKIGAFFMVDIAHPAGLIAADIFPSPVSYADVVTTTTGKTLWGPHAGLIMFKERYAQDINRSVHPGTQSSVPISRLIQVTLTLLFAETDEFKACMNRTIHNAKILEKAFSDVKNCLLFGGTDSHFIVIDTWNSFGLTGKEAENALEEIGIFTNRQIIPWESKKMYEASGLRIGASAATQRGFNESDFKKISEIIIDRLKNPQDNPLKNKLEQAVRLLTTKNIKENQYISF